MSGSSYGRRVLSRCIVGIDAGVRRSFATAPDGTNPQAEYHARHQRLFEQRIDRATAELEVVFDELEERGRRFDAPSTEDFEDEAQQTSHAFEVESYQLFVKCTPTLSAADLKLLGERVAAIVDQHRD